MKLILKKLLLTTAASIKGSSINANSSLDKKENKLVEQFLTWNNQLCIAIFYTADKFCEFLWQRYISVYFFVFIWWPLLPQSCWSWKRFSSREQIDEVKSRGNFDYVFLGKFCAHIFLHTGWIKRALQWNPPRCLSLCVFSMPSLIT